MRRKRKTHRRGRTRPGRLSLLNPIYGDLDHCRDEKSVAVDIGFGDEPITTNEWAETLRSTGDAWQVIGIEVEQSRVDAAVARHQEEGVVFRLGDFDSLGADEAHLIRCFNVLRGYGPERIAGAQLDLLAGLADGGVLIEGTTDTDGHLLTAHLWRRRSDKAHYEGLVLATDFERGFAPLMFRDVLPRDLRRNVHPGESIFEWLTTWEATVARLRPLASDSRALFEQSLNEMSQRDDTDLRWLSIGIALWTPRTPSGRPEVLQHLTPLPQTQRLRSRRESPA